MKSREKEKDSDNDSDAEVDDDDADDDDDDDDDDVEEKNKKKRKRRKGRGNEEDAWLPDELTDGPLGKETKLQIQQRAQLGSGQYKVITSTLIQSYSITFCCISTQSLLPRRTSL